MYPMDLRKGILPINHGLYRFWENDRDTLNTDSNRNRSGIEGGKPRGLKERRGERGEKNLGTLFFPPPGKKKSRKRKEGGRLKNRARRNAGGL